MEYRKLISFGKNSFVVSLPKPWVIQNKLKKGDLIYIEENGPGLVLSSKENQKENSEKTKVINIDGKSSGRLQREVNAAYILNNRRITLKGNELKRNIKRLQQTLQNLIALEVMEQTSDTIIAKDFLNMKKVSVDELLRKMDVVTRAMFTEARENFTKESYLNLSERDNDVNRLFFLLYRTILYNLDNPMSAVKNFKLTPAELLSYHFCAFYLEKVADEVRRTARYTHQIKVDENEKTKLKDFLAQVNKYYLDVMKAIYSRDEDFAFKLAEHKKTLNIQMENLKSRNKNVENYDLMIGRMRMLLSYIHNMTKSVYQGYNYHAMVK